MARQEVDITKFKKVLFISNPKSGQQLFSSMISNIGEAEVKLRKLLGKDVLIEKRLSSFEQIRALGRFAAEQKVEWVIVAGGDGTLRALVEEFVDNAYWPYISIYPSGTVNLVAKELMQVKDPERWYRRITKGIVTPVWLGKANDRIFLTVAGIGVDSLVVDNVSEKEKKYLSKFAYVRQGSELIRKELLLSNWKYTFKVMIDDDKKWRTASSVIVAKSRYYAGRFSLVDGGSLSSPTLHVCMFTGNKRADFLRYAALFATDMLTLDKSVKVIPAKKVKIKCNVENFVAELDGDSLVSSPLDIELIEKPLNFIS